MEKGMIKHTPGPWEVRDVAGAGLQVWGNVDLGGDEFREGLQPIYVVHVRPQLMVGNDGKAHAQICYEDWRQFPSLDWNEMQAANARLIAAAPDLLEACKAMLGHVGGSVDFCDAMAMIRAAISKAEGDKRC